MPVTTPQTPREIGLLVLERQLGKAYLWKGDDPITGFDCSGLMIEALKSAGRLPKSGDWSAAVLATMFPSITGSPKPGDLLFWNRTKPDGTVYVGHVEMVVAVIGGTVFTIGASGGGSATTTIEAAIRENAFVKLRPATPGWVKVVDPFA